MHLAIDREIEGDPYPNLDEEFAYQRLQALAACHGLEVVEQKNLETQWNADGVLRVRTQGMQGLISDLAHELAHYAVATPLQRRTPDFGLGWAPDSEWSSTERLLVESDHALVMETLASVFGMLLEAWAGHDPLRYTWRHHSWGWNDPKLMPSRSELGGAWHHLRLLRAMGMISGKPRQRYWPTISSRLRSDSLLPENLFFKDVTWLDLGWDPFRGWRIPFVEVAEKQAISWPIRS